MAQAAEMIGHEATQAHTTPAEPYEPPAIEWEEVLEEAGVYAACVKDEFGSPTSACLSAPMAPSGS